MNTITPFRVSLFLAASLLALPASSQQLEPFVPGYVVTPEGDTLRGQVADQIDLRATLSARFRTTGESARTFRPHHLLAYGIDGGRRFVTLVVPPFAEHDPEPLFVVPLVEGDELSLFRFEASLPRTEQTTDISDRGSTTRFAIRQADGTVRGLYFVRRVDRSDGIRMVLDAQYQRVLASAFAGCPDAQARTPRLRYTEQALIRAVIEFNECMGAPFASLEADQARRSDMPLDFNVRLVGGARSITHHRGRAGRAMSEPSIETHGSGSLWALEIGIEPRIAKIDTRLALPIALSLRMLVLEDDWIPEAPVGTFYTTDDFNRMSAGLSMALGYMIPTNGISPYIQAGGVSSSLFGEPSLATPPLGPFPSWEAGVFLEVGGRAGVVPRLHALTFGLRYERTGIGHPTPWRALSASSWITSSVLGVVGVQI